MKTKFGKTIAGVALLFCAYGAGGCHGDLDIMQDNKLSASNMWKEESDATSATYGLQFFFRQHLNHSLYHLFMEMFVMIISFDTFFRKRNMNHPAILRTAAASHITFFHKAVHGNCQCTNRH